MSFASEGLILPRTPGWVRYLNQRLPGEAPHVADDFFSDDALTDWTTLTVSGSQTITEENGALSVRFSSQSAAQLGAVIRELPVASSPITVEVAYRFVGKRETYNIFGFGFSDGVSSTSKISFANAQTHDQGKLEARDGTFSAVKNPISAVDYTDRGWSPFFVRLVWKSSNTFAVAYSPDGVSWSDLGLSTMSNTISPTHVFLGWSRWGGGAEEGVVSYDYVRVYDADLSA